MVLDLDQFPGNAHKEAGQETKETKSYESGDMKRGKKINGKASVKKKSAGRVAAEKFLMKDLGMVKEHMIDDVIKPNLYIGLSDVLHGLIDIIFSETVANGIRRGGKKKQIEYDKASYRDYNRASGIGRSVGGNAPLRAKRKSRDIDDLYLESQGDAITVLDDLRWRISEYGEATVYDLYDAVGVSTDYTDQSWGWTNLDEADAVRVRGGSYLLRLPRPKHLKNN